MPDPETFSQLQVRDLIPRLCHLHYEQIRVRFDDLGLYRGQGHVLRQLWKQDGLTITELGSQHGVRPSTITKTLQRMEKSGWLVRRKDPDDRRVSRVYLTEAGRQIQAQVEAAEAEAEALVLEGFTMEERVLLRRLLLQAVQNLWRHHPPDDDAS